MLSRERLYKRADPRTHIHSPLKTCPVIEYSQIGLTVIYINMYTGIERMPNSQKQATEAGNYETNDQTNLGKFRFSKRFSIFNLFLQVLQLTEIILVIWRFHHGI